MVLKKFRCYPIFFVSLTLWYRTKLRAIVPNRNYFKPIILKFETFIYNSGSKIICNFCIYGDNTPPAGGEVTPPGEKFFTVSIFRKNVSKYVKLMVEPYICDNLNHNYRFFSFLTKKNLKLENRLEGIRLISFVHVWLYFTGTKIICSFLKIKLL